MSGRDTAGLPDARPASAREVLWRFGSRWVAIALVLELALLAVDASASTRILASAYLVPVLGVAIVETTERTGLVALVAAVLTVLSGALHSDFLSTTHLYRLGIVGGGGALATLGAAFRSRAVIARDQMEMLAQIGEVADGTEEIEGALRRMAAILVPRAADLCELIVFEGDAARRVVTRLAAPQAGAEALLLRRPAEPSPTALGAVRSGEAVLIRDLGRDGASLGADHETLRRLGMRSVIYAPVRVADTTLALLVVAVGRSGRRYGPEDRRFVTTVGSRAGLAIQNARLLTHLRAAQQRMEAIVGSLADAVTIREPSGNLVYANDAALTSMGLTSVQDMQDRGPLGLFNQFTVTDEGGERLRMEDLPSVKLLAGEKPEPLLLRFLHEASGEERWSLLKATPLYDAQGQIEAAVTIIEDVTASKRAERQSAFLSRASEILASSLDYEETLGNVAWLAVPQFADWCAVDLVDAHGQRQQVVTAHRDPAKLELAKRVRDAGSMDLDPRRGLGRVLHTGESELVPEVPAEMLEQAVASEEQRRLMRELRIRSALIVPMRGGDRIIGAMTLVNAESGRVFSTDDLHFAEQIAARAGVAVENARLYSERSRIAATLQKSLLPDALPEIGGWELASLYRPAGTAGEVDVGGDFYDAFSTGGSWFMLIGDVTGKGVEAAAMTSLVRHGARFVADHLPDPAQILARLDRSLRQQPTLSLCTALCMRIDGARVTLASAGHPLPLVVTDDGSRTIGRAGSVLGAFEDGDWPIEEIVLRPNEVLLLYTDGVTDTVGHAERFGEHRLSKTMAECGPLAPADLLGCLDSALSDFQVGAQADDTAALALRLAGQPQVAAAPAAERGAGS